MSGRTLSPGQETSADRRGANNYLNMKKVLRGFNPRAQNKIKELNQLEAGQAGLIVSIDAKTPEQSHMLTAIGISPCAAVHMIDNFPRHIIFKIGNRKYAADKEIGAMLFVAPV